MKTFLFIFLFLAGFQSFGQSAVVPAYDDTTVDGIVKGLYQVISGPAGFRRDWNQMRNLFRPEARLNSIGLDREGKPRFLSMTIEDYVRNAAPNFEQNGFFEQEIGRITEQYGDMVHVFSAYESRREEKGEVFARGINSIQLVKKDGRYWIVNIMWNSETKENPIPDKYLKK